MEQIKKDRVCPFCIEHLEKYHNKPIVKEFDWWLVTENFEPYEGTEVHLLLILKEHVVSVDKIRPEAGSELIQILSWATKKYDIKGGSLFMRFGDTDRTGSSVSHLHAQIVVGKSSKSEPGSEGLRVKLGYK